VTPAIGGLVDAASGERLGTVFAVAGRLALTAFHCVGERRTGKVRSPRVACEWAGHISLACVEEGDPSHDIALLYLDKQLPPALEPVVLTREVSEHTQFIAQGRPVEVPDVTLFTVSGEVLSLNGEREGVRVMQLACREAAAELALGGMSGAPVLVGQIRRAAGVVTWNPPRRDRPELGAGGAVFATPSSVVLDRWPQLEPAYAADAADLKRLLLQLSQRRHDRDAARIRFDIWHLLLAGDLGLTDYDLEADLDLLAQGHCRIVIRRGRTVIEIVKDLRVEGAVRGAEQRLDGCLAAYAAETGMRHLGVLTDGAEWHLYHRAGGVLTCVPPRHIVDASNPDAESLLAWLETVLATRQQIPPTPEEVRRKLGADSLEYKVDSADLTALYAQHRGHPTVQVKRAMWAKLLTTASGVNFADEDQLFVDHTLLVAMAEVVGHVLLGLRLDDPELSAEHIMSGWHFTENAQIRGVIESDFFDWVVHVPGGEPFIRELARRITRFAWADVKHDVMKVLYHSIIREETRKQLGEYYTPDWLAEKIVIDCIDNPLEQRVLDASCGSGTFLFHAIHRYVAAAAAEERGATETIEGLVRHVVGFDVHPVAVTLARVTYLLAMGTSLLEPPGGRPSFSVPVYLGDSLHWGQETSLYSQDLSVLTTLKPDDFVSDPGLTGRRERRLVFPDRTVADAGLFDQLVTVMADRAVQRERHTKPPSLAGAFKALGITDANDLEVLQDTFEKMCRLHDKEEDHIWGYYVRNLARPAWLARPSNRVDVLVGNPPWLAYMFMTLPQKRAFEDMCKNRGLWIGATVAPHQDLSALFVERCIEQYLCEEGKFGFVMPLATLTRRQYEGFRTGRYQPLSSRTQHQPEPVHISFDQPWDLHEIKPKFFRNAVGAIFGKRVATAQDGAPLDQTPELWSGRFDTEFATWAEAEPAITRVTAKPPELPADGSPYRSRFRQGATIVPRLLFLIESKTPIDQLGTGGNQKPVRLGTGGGRQPVHSLQRPKANKHYRDVEPLNGAVERKFIRSVYLGDSIAQFRCLKSFPAVIPLDGSRLLGQDDDDLDSFPGLAKWWRQAEDRWTQNRGPGNQLSLKQRLDYRRGISKQFPAPTYRVAFNKSGQYLAAAVICDCTVVIDHKLIWGGAHTHDEARYLTAVLNSTPILTAVTYLQGRGENNPRDFDKHVFRLAIPGYDPANATQRQLVTLAERAELVAADVALPTVSFEAQRRRIRQALSSDGVISDIDALAQLLLT
jgi:SAM-dependent methyltransferase